MADRAGLQAGDGILFINQANTDRLNHEQAKMEIIRSGNEIYLTVMRYIHLYMTVVNHEIHKELLL